MGRKIKFLFYLIIAAALNAQTVNNGLASVNAPTSGAAAEVSGNITKLLNVKANLANASATTVIDVIGDSMSINAPTSNGFNWSSQIVGALQANFGDGGPGFVSTEGSPSGSLTPTGSWTGISAGPFQSSGTTFNEVKQGTTGSTYALAFGAVDTIDVYYYNITGQAATSCSATVTGTGGSTQTFGANANLVPQVFTFSGLSLVSSHVITITSTDGNCAIFGVTGRMSGGGTYLFNTARASATSTAFGSAINLGWMATQSTLPSLVIVFLGENDPGILTTAQTLANMQTIITTVQALSNNPPILFLTGPSRQSDTGQAALFTAIRNFANTNGYLAASISDRWTTYTVANADGLCSDTTCHPSIGGHEDIATMLWGILNPMPMPSTRGNYYPSQTGLLANFIPGFHQGVNGSSTRFLIDGYNAPGFCGKHLNSPSNTGCWQMNGDGSLQISASVYMNLNSVKINSTGQEALAVGAPISSAITISPTGYITHITGTTTIQTITAPSQFATTNFGGCIVLIPDGLWSTNNAGNIALATTAVVSKALTLCYDNTAAKWYPSY